MVVGEIDRKIRRVIPAVLAAIGTSMLAPTVSYAARGCDVPAKISRLAGDIRSGGKFKWPVMESSSTTRGLVAIHEVPPSNSQYIYNPLLITCGSKIVDYAGVTLDSGKKNSLGTSYSLGESQPHGQPLYLDVVAFSKVGLKGITLFGASKHAELKEADPEMRLGLVHPVPEANWPILLEPSDPTNLSRAFGLMNDSF